MRIHFHPCMRYILTETVIFSSIQCKILFLRIITDRIYVTMLYYALRLTWTQCKTFYWMCSSVCAMVRIPCEWTTMNNPINVTANKWFIISKMLTKQTKGWQNVRRRLRHQKNFTSFGYINNGIQLRYNWINGSAIRRRYWILFIFSLWMLRNIFRCVCVYALRGSVYWKCERLRTYAMESLKNVLWYFSVPFKFSILMQPLGMLFLSVFSFTVARSSWIIDQSHIRSVRVWIKLNFGPFLSSSSLPHSSKSLRPSFSSFKFPSFPFSIHLISTDVDYFTIFLFARGIYSVSFAHTTLNIFPPCESIDSNTLQIVLHWLFLA